MEMATHQLRQRFQRPLCFLHQQEVGLIGLDEAREVADQLSIEKAYGSYEELLADSEFTRPTHHPKIRIARVAYVDAPRWATLQEWIGSEGCFDDDAVRRQMADLLPEYKPWKV